MNALPRILLAEDEEIIAVVVRDLLSAHGFRVVVCADGATAWDCLQADGEGFDVVLLDREMPQMDGMALLQRIKNDPALAHTPVVMETAQGDQNSIREGLAAGAYYYLTKPFEPELLVAIVRAAVIQAYEYRHLIESVRRAERPLTMMQAGTFRFRSLDEAHLLASYLARACPQPERVIHGLQELLVNAVEHGNLEISYAEKSSLMACNDWRHEVLRRLQMPAYRDRYVVVHYQRGTDTIQFTITDQGQGFDWERYLDFSPDRAFDLHGRGIAMASKISFDRLRYEGIGNTVVATVLAGAGDSTRSDRHPTHSGYAHAQA
jgi:DNA-binding response OmpR family regulator